MQGFGGIFSGLWSGVSNTIGQGIAYSTNQFNVKSGETEKERQAALQMAQLKAQQQQNILIVGVVVVVLIIVAVIVIKRRN